MKVIAVVPAYNESQTILDVVRDLKERVNEVMVVDDGSRDNTKILAEKEGAVALQHFLNRGQGAALKTGIDFALQEGADIIITFDADGQHDASDVPRLIEPIIRGEAEVVLGSRFKKNQKSNINPSASSGLTLSEVEWVKNQNYGMPILRLFILKLAVLFTKMTTGLKITDTHNGLRALSRAAAEKIDIRQDGMAHASEILEEIVRYNLRYVEIPARIRYTEYSKKKGQSAMGAFRILWDLIVGKMSK